MKTSVNSKTNLKLRLPGNQFFGWVTLSSKGQVAIPIALRRRLKIKTGDRFLMILRKETDGINLIQAEALDKVFKKFSK